MFGYQRREHSSLLLYYCQSSTSVMLSLMKHVRHAHFYQQAQVSITLPAPDQQMNSNARLTDSLTERATRLPRVKAHPPQLGHLSRSTIKVQYIKLKHTNTYTYTHTHSAKDHTNIRTTSAICIVHPHTTQSVALKVIQLQTKPSRLHTNARRQYSLYSW